MALLVILTLELLGQNKQVVRQTDRRMKGKLKKKKDVLCLDGTIAREIRQTRGEPSEKKINQKERRDSSVTGRLTRVRRDVRTVKVLTISLQEERERERECHTYSYIQYIHPPTDLAVLMRWSDNTPRTVYMTHVRQVQEKDCTVHQKVLSLTHQTLPYYAMQKNVRQRQ